jgi:hypothetical protein
VFVAHSKPFLVGLAEGIGIPVFGFASGQRICFADCGFVPSADAAVVEVPGGFELTNVPDSGAGNTVRIQPSFFRNAGAFTWDERLRLHRHAARHRRPDLRVRADVDADRALGRALRRRPEGERRQAMLDFRLWLLRAEFACPNSEVGRRRAQRRGEAVRAEHHPAAPASWPRPSWIRQVGLPFPEWKRPRPKLFRPARVRLSAEVLDKRNARLFGTPGS